MRRFSQVIDELELKDQPLHGGSFTWRGGLSNQRMARLNRFLVIDDWDELFDEAIQKFLPKPTSNHSPLLLEGRDSNSRGPLPFRFENMWLKTDRFTKLIFYWWQSWDFRGTSSYIMMEKLKTKLKSWNKEVFWRVEVRKRVALEKLVF